MGIKGEQVAEGLHVEHEAGSSLRIQHMESFINQPGNKLAVQASLRMAIPWPPEFLGNYVM